MGARKLIASAVFVLIAFWSDNLLGAEYFPKNLDMPKNHIIPSGYSKILKNVKEPALWLNTKNSRAASYRLIYRLYKGSHEPVILRVDRISKAKWVLTVKQPDYSPNESDFRVNRKKLLTRSEVVEFQRLFNQLEFWKMPVVGALEAESCIFDGSAWLLEAVEGGHYHIVMRDSPKYTATLWDPAPELDELRKKEGWPYIDKATNEEANKKLVALGEFLVKLADLRLELY